MEDFVNKRLGTWTARIATSNHGDMEDRMNCMSPKIELERLGYHLEKVSRDFLNNPMKYRTVPLPKMIEQSWGGGTNYFNSLDEVKRYIVQVKRIRKIMEDCNE